MTTKNNSGSHRFSKITRPNFRVKFSHNSHSPPFVWGETRVERGLLTKSYADSLDFKPKPEDTLIGNRLLCRRGSLFLFGPAGQGKSSLVVQLTSLWAVGKDFHGIGPNQSLRILYIQAEDDEGDFAEQVQVARYEKFSKEEMERLARNTRWERVNGPSGGAFVGLLRRCCQEWLPDLIVINPYQAYSGGDVTDDKHNTPFLRQHMDGLLAEFNCGAIIVGHTTKLSSKQIALMDRLQRMFAAAGTAQIANWPRAMWFLATTDAPSVFDLWAVKREKRTGWPDYHITIAQSTVEGQIHWKERTGEQAFDATPKHHLTADDALVYVPYEPEWVSWDGFAAKVNERREVAIGQQTMRGWLRLLVEEGKVKTRPTVRPGKSPGVGYFRIGKKDTGQKEEP